MKLIKLYSKLRYLNLIILIIGLSACSKENEDLNPDNEDGTFEITITGDENSKIEGEAAFFHVSVQQGEPDDVGSSLAITLTNEGDEAFTITLTNENPGGISEGTYDYVEELTEGSTFVSFGYYSSISNLTFLAASGTVKLTKITANTIEGTIEGEMTSFNDQTINVTGSFKASGISQFF